VSAGHVTVGAAIRQNRIGRRAAVGVMMPSLTRCSTAGRGEVRQMGRAGAARAGRSGAMRRRSGSSANHGVANGRAAGGQPKVASSGTARMETRPSPVLGAGDAGWMRTGVTGTAAAPVQGAGDCDEIGGRDRSAKRAELAGGGKDEGATVHGQSVKTARGGAGTGWTSFQAKSPAKRSRGPARIFPGAAGVFAARAAG
jgi:hypothetical protein